MLILVEVKNLVIMELKSFTKQKIRRIYILIIHIPASQIFNFIFCVQFLLLT